MCCLFGIVNYSGAKNPEIDSIVNYLAQEATIRGMDSTGIAYNKDGKLKVYKKPKNAYELNFKGLENCVCVSGHTRHATQGSHLKNYNNHPFYGECVNAKFALSHNGVLWNDVYLRKQFELPADRIETDSYIAVQLLEHFQTLTVKNVARMAELVSGSFTFTMTDNHDNLWIVKGDNPLALIHFPHLNLYAYASTTQILFTALCRTDLVDDIASGDFEIIPIKSGDIVQIDKNGHITVNRFKYDDYGAWGYDWRTYTSGNNSPYDYNYWDDNAYNAQWLEDIKSVARSMGIEDSLVDELYNEGFTLDELEEFIYSYYEVKV